MQSKTAQDVWMNAIVRAQTQFLSVCILREIINIALLKSDFHLMLIILSSADFSYFLLNVTLHQLNEQYKNVH